MAVLVGKEMRRSYLLNPWPFLRDGEDLIQVLLEVGDEAEDTVVFDGSFEGLYIFDEYLVEVAEEIFDLVEEVVLEEEMQVAKVLPLQLVYLTLQQVLRTVDHLIKFVKPFSHVLWVCLFDVISEFLKL